MSRERGPMRVWSWFVVAVVATAAIAAGFASSAGAYGGAASHDMWQVGMSFNCNSPTLCGGETGGFWGWAEFDRSADGTQTWGDAQLTGCGHTIGGGGKGSAGAGHSSIEIESWTIEPGSAGPQTFFASGEETDFFPGGVKETFDFAHQDTGISALPGHYSTSDVLGFSAPGIAVQIQVAFRPAK
jgi:hypothetical protein